MGISLLAPAYDSFRLFTTLWPSLKTHVVSGPYPCPSLKQPGKKCLALKVSLAEVSLKVPSKMLRATFMLRTSQLKQGSSEGAPNPKP